jgi:hypothetical protein
MMWRVVFSNGMSDPNTYAEGNTYTEALADAQYKYGKSVIDVILLPCS